MGFVSNEYPGCVRNKATSKGNVEESRRYVCKEISWDLNILTWLRVDLRLHQSSYTYGGEHSVVQVCRYHDRSTTVALDELGIQQQTSDHYGNGTILPFSRTIMAEVSTI